MSTETPEWAKADPADVLVYHQRNGIKGCTCGWAEVGKSFPKHQVAALFDAGWGVVPRRGLAEMVHRTIVDPGDTAAEVLDRAATTVQRVIDGGAS
jgi:hypothetical protein